MLRGKANIEKAAHKIQNNMISEENVIMPKMRLTSKEFLTNVSHDKKSNNESKVIDRDKWF